MHTKTITVETNWLDEIDGMTVAQAIAYLQTLNPEHTLSYYMEGDTHGCNVVSELHYAVPMTNEEIYAGIEKHFQKQIKYFQTSKERHIKNKQFQFAESCDKRISEFQAKLNEAKLKYCKG